MWLMYPVATRAGWPARDEQPASSTRPASAPAILRTIEERPGLAEALPPSLNVHRLVDGRAPLGMLGVDAAHEIHVRAGDALGHRADGVAGAEREAIDREDRRDL